MDAEGPWIQSTSGRVWSLTNPRVEDVDLADIAHALGNLCRFNGHSCMFFSVAEHSLLVADVVEPELRVYGLLHDAHEAWTGDISTPMKLLLSPELECIQESIDRVIHEACGLAWPLSDEMQMYVAVADRYVLALERGYMMRDCPREWPGELLPVRLSSSPFMPLGPREAASRWLEEVYICLPHMRPAEDV